MSETLKVVLFVLSVLLVTGSAALILNWFMKKKEFRFNPWVTLGISIGMASLQIILWGISMRVVTGTILCLILLYASFQDITYHEADDSLWVMILILAFINFSIDRVPFMILGAMAVFLPQMLVVLFTKNKAIQIGGADIKVSTAAAFLLGFFPGTIGFMAGLLIAIVVQLIRSKIKKSKAVEAFPLLPYLSIGLMAGFLL